MCKLTSLSILTTAPLNPILAHFSFEFRPIYIPDPSSIQAFLKIDILLIGDTGLIIFETWNYLWLKIWRVMCLFGITWWRDFHLLLLLMLLRVERTDHVKIHFVRNPYLGLRDIFRIMSEIFLHPKIEWRLTELMIFFRTLFSLDTGSILTYQQVHYDNFV